MNVFYFIWLLEVIAFGKCLYLLRAFFRRHILAFFEASVLKELRILSYLYNISANNKVSK